VSQNQRNRREICTKLSLSTRQQILQFCGTWR
jgi:hypothetical protein